MKYIYTLSFNGRVFYVGCSSDPVNRYRSHLLGTKTNTSLFIKYRLSVEPNKFPSLGIVAHFKSSKKALAFEVKTISFYNKQLLNIRGNKEHKAKKIIKTKDDRLDSRYYHNARKSFLKYVKNNIKRMNWRDQLIVHIHTK